MEINSENYFSKENNKKYMGSSQFKSFMKCEQTALAELNEEYIREKNTALLVGSYVDSYFEGTLEKFKTENPELFKKDGTLKSTYVKADELIARIERDEVFMKYMSGKKQVIKTGEIEGVPVKIKIDSYHEGKCIVDLKCMKDMQSVWNAEKFVKESFVEAWGYDIQAAIYQEIEGNKLPVVLAVVTKETEPDIALLEIPQDRLDYVMENIVRPNIKRFQDIKDGKIEPTKCGKCNYCKSIKKLTLEDVIDYREVK